MRRILACLVLLSLVSILSNPFQAQTSSFQAQTRPRRVQDTPAKPGPSAPSTSGQTSPTRPPVLGGANNPTNREPAQAPAVPSGPEEVDAGDVIRVNTTLVTLPVSVMDRDGRYVPNLRKEDFHVLEDGMEQEVAFFSSVDKPFSVVLMIDTSNSTRFKLEDIHEAAITFVNQLRPDDRVMIVSFDDDIEVLSDFSIDRGKLTKAIRRARTGNGTRLYDAVDMVMNQQLSQVSGRKAVVLFTDGVDTTSKGADYQSNVLDAEELDALIYPVQYDTFVDVGGGGPTWPGTRTDDVLGQILGGILGGGRVGRGGRGGRGGVAGTSRREYEVANRYLDDLSVRTGARKYQADSIQNLATAFSNIAEELRRQYSIGYYPKRAPYQGERRQIRVRVNRPNLAVRARDSYVFKQDAGIASQDAGPRPPLLKRLAGRDEP
ncbi:MAG TPA: VWA domain-containing protein [Pyrinomonadaceae bacterium]|nr:VWA domain-containing protein [Pyrinomonadaceae bacterium]